MSRMFKGRPVLAANVEGEAIVTHQGFNTLASFYQSILTDAKEAICSDQDNQELYQKNLTGKILCLPKTVGSTSSGATWDKVAVMSIAPKALLFSERIDSLAAAGMTLVDIWVGKRIVAVDELGSEFLSYVKDGMNIVIQEDGTVFVS